MEQAILQQDPSLVAAHLPEPNPVCPYLGLVPYDIGDAEAFFGRDATIAACLQRLADTGVLAVVGPSGSGKSSLVRAGIAAALARDGHRVIVITPGAWPMDAISAVPSSGRLPVLVVDQCEEAVTLCTDPAERAEFFAALAERAKGAPLIVALRADRLGELVGAPGFRPDRRARHFVAPSDGRGRPPRRLSTDPPAKPGSSLNPGWSTCWSERWRASRAPCHCCLTRCTRLGSAGRGGR